MAKDLSAKYMGGNSWPLKTEISLPENHEIPEKRGDSSNLIKT